MVLSVRKEKGKGFNDFSNCNTVYKESFTSENLRQK